MPTDRPQIQCVMLELSRFHLIADQTSTHWVIAKIAFGAIFHSLVRRLRFFSHTSFIVSLQRWLDFTLSCFTVVFCSIHPPFHFIYTFVVCHRSYAARAIINSVPKFAGRLFSLSSLPFGNGLTIVKHKMAKANKKKIIQNNKRTMLKA